MKFSNTDKGVFISGATLFNPTEQALHIIDFAATQGFDIDENELTHLKLDLDAGVVDVYDEVDYVLEDALEYLNTHCVDDGCVFTFVDSDFVLVGSDE
jgi:hypothetical protein